MNPSSRVWRGAGRIREIAAKLALFGPGNTKLRSRSPAIDAKDFIAYSIRTKAAIGETPTTCPAFSYERTIDAVE